jgi:predicted tellurium resistance membrane protein TerC
MTITTLIIITLLIAVVWLAYQLHQYKQDYKIFATMIYYMKTFMINSGIDESWKEYYETVYDSYENTKVTKIKLSEKDYEEKEIIH